MKTGFYRVGKDGCASKILLFLEGYGFFTPKCKVALSLNQLQEKGFRLIGDKIDISK